MTTARPGPGAAAHRPAAEAVGAFIASHWLKKRLVLDQKRAGPTLAPVDPADGIAVHILTGGTSESSLPSGILAAIARTLGAEVLRKRLERPDITLVTGIDRRSHALMGFRWILHPTKDTVWHDNIPIEPGDAYGFNEFTYPEFRRRGVYGTLIAHGNRHVFEDLGRSRIAIVVEAGNLASLNANLRAGYSIVGTNYLVKVWRRNVYSVFRDAATGKTRAYYVYRNERAGKL